MILCINFDPPSSPPTSRHFAISLYLRNYKHKLNRNYVKIIIFELLIRTQKGVLGTMKEIN